MKWQIMLPSMHVAMLFYSRPWPLPCASQFIYVRFEDTAFLHSVLQLLVTTNVPSSTILVTLMMEAIRSSETSVLTRATRCKIPEDGILHSHRRENLKSYIALIDWTR
jgi:hypothetical protein